MRVSDHDPWTGDPPRHVEKPSSSHTKGAYGGVVPRATTLAFGPPPAGAIQHTHLADSSPYVCVEAVEKGSPGSGNAAVRESHHARADAEPECSVHQHHELACTCSTVDNLVQW